MEWIIAVFILWVLSLIFDRSGKSSLSDVEKTKGSKEYYKNLFDDINDDKIKVESSEDKKVEVNDKGIVAGKPLVSSYDRLKESSKNIHEILNTSTRSVDCDSNKKFELFSNKDFIKREIKSKGIVQLIHFTRYENIESIINNGIFTRDNLNENSFFNDKLRLDGHRNSISVSVSFPNYKMFYKYRKNTDARGWVVIAISPDVLLDYDCAFCKHNAADLRVSTQSLDVLSSVKSFREMFLEDVNETGTRSSQRLKEFDTTDPQAEVLIFGDIPVKYILAIGFEDHNLLLEAQNNANAGHIKFQMANKYFNSRGYVR